MKFLLKRTSSPLLEPEKYYIELATLEDLVRLRETSRWPLILDLDSDSESAVSLEVYDDWRE